jgi:hypothetical protein
MAYIEKDKAGEYRNPASCTTIINPDSSSSSAYKATNENEERWAWLINGWDSMSFKERLGLFLPYLHYVNTRNVTKAEFDDTFQNEIIENSYKLCRMFKEFKFDPDGQGVPNLIMVFEPIDINAIPNGTIRNSIKSWAVKNRLYKSDRYCNCSNSQS